MSTNPHPLWPFAPKAETLKPQANARLTIPVLIRLFIAFLAKRIRQQSGVIGMHEPFFEYDTYSNPSSRAEHLWASPSETAELQSPGPQMV